LGLELEQASLEEKNRCEDKSEVATGVAKGALDLRGAARQRR
jgi:hypothetical protein